VIVHFPFSIELFLRLPRHPDWKYEFLNGHAVLSPRPRPLALRRLTALPVTQSRPDIEVRALDVASDRDAVAALLADTWSREDPYRSLDEPVETLRGEIEPGLDNALCGAVAVQSGAVRAAALVHDQDTPTLTWLTVAPDARERGLASGLLALLTAELHQRGVRELASATSATNTISLRWHLTRGFALAADPLREAQRSSAPQSPQAPCAPAPTTERPPLRSTRVAAGGSVPPAL
jgi:GNAT superfamily N-acetyltransferase